MMSRSASGFIFTLLLMFGGTFAMMFSGGGVRGLPETNVHDQAAMQRYVQISLMPDVCVLSEDEANAVRDVLPRAQAALSEQDLRLSRRLAQTQLASIRLSGGESAACDQGFAAMAGI